MWIRIEQGGAAKRENHLEGQVVLDHVTRSRLVDHIGKLHSPAANTVDRKL